MGADGAVSFTVQPEGIKGKSVKSFTLRPGTNAAVRIGRAPGNDIVVDHRGASQYHAELRLLPEASGGGHALHVRDLSMNGTGLKRADGAQAVCLPKLANEPLPDGAILLVPFMLKASLTSTDRTWLKVCFQASPANQEETPPPPPAAQAPANDGSASEQDEEKVAEKNRMQFVDLLLKTREVNASTTYDEAQRLLSSDEAWDAVDERTRRECFDIFVEHLGTHKSKKNKKKDKNKAGKKEKRRHREDDDAAPALKDAAAEAPKAKRRKDGDRKGGSGSPERAHRKGKRDKKGRDKSRGRSPANCSRSGSRQQKKRRRGRSGSA